MMVKGRSEQDDSLQQHGVPLESVLAQRERFADRYDIDFGKDRVFPDVIEALYDAIPEGANVLEVGAATGLLTRPLLQHVGHLTALEPSAGLLRRLLSADSAESPHLTVKQGMVEDLLHDETYDVAVVTFTPRRGRGLARLLVELARRVRYRVIMLLDDDGSMDWAYLGRGASLQGFDVTMRLLAGPGDGENVHRVVVLIADVENWVPQLSESTQEWGVDAREIKVPFPPPRGAATRLVRYFLAGGDRALLILTDERGVERLYGNLRTAVHRLGKDEITVRRNEDRIQIVRLPKDTLGEGSDTLQ
ncbi:MAG: class I SAM-dependent methyltransferase [Actinomycetota bacterium]|jgi:hypothetical protein|nr:class I SAM-dependent methyltransferase [Actinomycetota bacterium]